MKNKLMLCKRRTIFYLFLVCLFLAQGCKKELLQPSSKGMQNGLSIAEAKAYYDANFKKPITARKLMSTKGGTGNAIGEPTIEDILYSKEAMWKSAYQKIISTGGAVKVPLDFGKTYLVTNKAKKEMVPFGALNYLFMYKDSLQDIQAEWVTLFPDSTWLYGKRDKYVGKIVIRTWSGKFIKEYTYDSPNINSTLNNSIKAKTLSSHTGATGVQETEEIIQPICIEIYHEFCGQCITDKLICIWPPEPPICVLCDDPPIGGGSGSSGGSGASGGGGLGGGSTGPGDYPPSPNCNPDPSYVMPNYPAPAGTQWILPCGEPETVPIPIPIVLTPSQFVIQVLGITDLNKVAFISDPSSGLGNAFAQYLIREQNSPYSIEFGQWLFEYLYTNQSVDYHTFLDPNEFDGISNQPTTPPAEEPLIDNGIVK